MTVDDFNHKWGNYLGEGHYGMDIDILSVILFLDNEFETEVKENSAFEFYQIKLKFERCTIYAKSNKANSWQDEINKMLGNTEPRIFKVK
jgi:hypothetical protein